ncbi:MAG: hypothetical protein PHV59_04045 [Victivallales bacterium]|nr:hypothetical protein [Victivallales bacterium]
MSPGFIFSTDIILTECVLPDAFLFGESLYSQDKNFKYQVVAGRKSFAALTQIIGKTELQIPEEVSFIEGDADIIAFAENDERTNLSLAEQVDKLEKLSEKFGIAELASHLSHSPQWIAARIKLKDLADCWKQAMRENEFPHFVIGHYEVIAKYPENIQEQVFEYCHGWNFEEKISVAKFSKKLRESFMFLLKNAPWNTDSSYQGCGECPACLDRQNNSYLFPELNDYSKAACMNRDYYYEQLHKFIVAKVEEARQLFPDILLVAQENHVPEDFPLDMEEIYPPYAWSKSTRKDGGQKALIVNGPQTGKMIFAKISDHYQFRHDNASDNPAQEEEPQKRPSILAERKERKLRQRQRHCISALIEYLEAFEYPTPDRDTIFQLIACLGVNSIYSMSLHEGIASYPAASELDNLDTDVWKKLVENIVCDLKHGQTGPVEARWTEAEIISQIINFDLQKAFETAIEVLPDPKSWKELEKPEKSAA